MGDGGRRWGERGASTASYEDDVDGWSTRQAELLRAGRHDVDMENVAEEIDSLGKFQVAWLGSCHRPIAAHLSKVLFRPERQARNQQVTVVRERLDAQSRLDVSPSLTPRRPALFEKNYRQARRLAPAETGLPTRMFPEQAPSTLEEPSSESHTP